MGKKYRPLRILKQVEPYLISVLSKRQLKIFLLLIVVAKENNGRGEIEYITIKNLAGECFNGEDLFVICQVFKRFGWGRLTCCKENNPELPPCLTENWRDLRIGVDFLELEKGDENAKP